MSWSSTLNAFRAAIGLADPSIVELPNLLVENFPNTMAQPGKIGFTVNVGETAWENDRQRTKIRVTHAFTVDVIITMGQHGNSQDTMVLMLDTEQAILAQVLEIANLPGVSVYYQNTSRDISGGGVYIVASMSFTVSQSSSTGANA